MTDKLTPFQQELWDAARTLAAANRNWVMLSSDLNIQSLHEAEAALFILVQQAYSNIDDHHDACDCGLTSDEHWQAYGRWIERNKVKNEQ